MALPRGHIQCRRFDGVCNRTPWSGGRDGQRGSLRSALVLLLQNLDLPRDRALAAPPWPGRDWTDTNAQIV